jgi:glyoxylase-like metal-dependent hydrolase (beta-lactamase superfamily II)
MKSRSFAPSLLAAALLMSGAIAHGQPADTEKVELKTSKVAGSVSMIEGVNGFAGGNVGVSVGDDGMFVIDDELLAMSPKLRAALAALSTEPVRFVINTHWHFDHTGGNATLGKAGAILIAHDNVRKRLSVGQFVEALNLTIPPAKKEALPVVTFAEDVTLHLNGDEIHAVHVPPSHTDGDVVVYFQNANVLHMGDVYVSQWYPIVDTASGGSYEGFITAVDRALRLCNDKTRIIPGHGPITGRHELEAWRNMIVEIKTRIAKLVAARKTLEQVKAAKPTESFDAKYGGGFIKPDQLVETVYKALTQDTVKTGATKPTHG